MKQGIKTEFVKKISTEVVNRFNKIMYTIRTRDLQKDLEDCGFVEFKTRNHGRYDMQIDMTDFPILQGSPPWMDLITAILGPGAQLTYSGCIIGIPGAVCQPWHSDGNHLSEHYLPPHAVNVFVPLVDLTKNNGPTQFVPGSQREFETKNSSIVILASAGECILFDYRLKHRGLNNSSSTIRPVLYFTYAQPHFVQLGDENFSKKRYKKLPSLLEYTDGKTSRAMKRERGMHKEQPKGSQPQKAVKPPKQLDSRELNGNYWKTISKRVAKSKTS